MAKRIQAWTEYGPRLELQDALTDDELMRRAVSHTNQSRGSLQAALDEIDVLIEEALRSGQPVQLPNGMHMRPVGHADGSITVDVRLNADLVKRINTEFGGKWRNADNIGKSEADIVALWNKFHPNDPIEL